MNSRRLRNTARRVLLAENCPENAEVSILLTGDEAIRELNSRYRGIDAPTDVLAFSQLEGEEFAEEGEVVLGDVVISVETAARQAMEHGHTLEDEMDILLAHGILHLLGYDHGTPEDEKKMFERQRELVV
ncbi:MAG: rRNA maturation RNase YbeY [Armatimonadota bacterium]